LHRPRDVVDGLTLYGLFAVAAILICYALESRAGQAITLAKLK